MNLFNEDFLMDKLFDIEYEFCASSPIPCLFSIMELLICLSFISLPFQIFIGLCDRILIWYLTFPGFSPDLATIYPMIF